MVLRTLALSWCHSLNEWCDRLLKLSIAGRQADFFVMEKRLPIGYDRFHMMVTDQRSGEREDFNFTAPPNSDRVLEMTA